MAQGKQQPKFERNPYIRFRDYLRHGRTDGRMTDGRRIYELWWHSPAELKGVKVLLKYPSVIYVINMDK